MESQINSLFENLVRIGTAVAVSVAAFFVLWGAFIYMSAGGSPRQMETGKSAIVNALLGLAIALAAVTIARALQQALGSGV